MHLPLPRPLCHSKHSEKTLPRDITRRCVGANVVPMQGVKVFSSFPVEMTVWDSTAYAKFPFFISSAA